MTIIIHNHNYYLIMIKTSRKLCRANWLLAVENYMNEIMNEIIIISRMNKSSKTGHLFPHFFNINFSVV